MAYNVNPQSTIHLVKTKLEQDYEHTFRFASKQAQTEYFDSLIPSGVNLSGYTYVRKDKYIVVDKNIDDIISYNYLFYENGGFPNIRRYYCFITKMEYVSENDTRIYFETDVMQTYLFDLQFNRCFVEREHVNNDTVGLHTIPEGLETGEFILNGTPTIPDMASSHVVVGATIDLTSDDPFGSAGMVDTTGGMQMGVFSGLAYFLFRNTEDVNKALKRAAFYGKAEGIVLMFMAPDSLTAYDLIVWSSNHVVDPDYSTTGIDYYCFKMGETTASMAVPALARTITKPSSLNGYTPRNNKLLCYPYNYLNVTNFNGCEGEYKYEYFSGNACTFEGYGTIGAGCSIILKPTNYQLQEGVGQKQQAIFEIPCGKYPVCSYSSDYYTNWLSQNGLNIRTQFMQSGTNLLASMAGAAATGNLAATTSGIANSFNQITNTIASMDQHQMKANTVEGNTNSTDVNFASGYIGFGFYPMSIKAQFARIIDNYLSMYGYKVHTTKVPNISSRRYWNFIKTIKCNVEADIPQEDLQIIRNNFDKGITFWHDPANIYNYNLNNTIV